MTARYELRDPGVFDRELGRVITVMDDEWPVYHAWLDAGGVADLAPAPPPPDLEFVRAEKIAAVQLVAADQRRKVTAPSSPSEMASWTEKLRQARAYVAGVDSTAPMLALEGRSRGTSTQDIVSRVLANADQFSQAEAVIAGTSGRHKDALAALATLEEVLAYDITAGWPLQEPVPPATST